MAADRDLLFGMVALRTGLVNRSRLMAAFRDWPRSEHESLAEYLVATGSLGTEDCDAIEAVVARQIARHGDAGRGLDAIPTGRSIRERFARLRDRGLATTLPQPDIAGGATFPEGGPGVAVVTDAPAGGRFRILRPHAQGGLGAVFVALDAELNREVALKQILDRHADDPTSRTRFLLEAEITGGLEHPGIVPVYSLGTTATAGPFYAMRFIRGDSLKQAIERFHGRGRG